MEHQERYFQTHKKQILRRKARFAVVHEDGVEYFNTRKKVYSAYPSLNPDNSEITTGTNPLLIDIGEKNNRRDYRLEKLQEKEEELKKSLVRKQQEIISERKKLDNLE